MSRPTIFTHRHSKKLRDAIWVGATVKDACIYARISRKTFYNWLEEKKGFRHRIQGVKRRAKELLNEREIPIYVLNRRWLREKHLAAKARHNRSQTFLEAFVFCDGFLSLRPRMELREMDQATKELYIAAVAARKSRLNGALSRNEALEAIEPYIARVDQRMQEVGQKLGIEPRPFEPLRFL